MYQSKSLTVYGKEKVANLLLMLFAIYLRIELNIEIGIGIKIRPKLLGCILRNAVSFSISPGRTIEYLMLLIFSVKKTAWITITTRVAMVGPITKVSMGPI